MRERSRKNDFREAEAQIPPHMRLDRWLKAARLFKTRTWAKKACEDGLVKIDRKRAKPSHAIGIGDTVSINRKGKLVFYEVRGLTERSLPAREAAGLYREVQTIESRPTGIMDLILRAERRGGPGTRKGRPTKKERRSLTKVRGY